MKKADGRKNENFLDIKRVEMEQDTGGKGRWAVGGVREGSNNKKTPTLSYLR